MRMYSSSEGHVNLISYTLEITQIINKIRDLFITTIYITLLYRVSYFIFNASFKLSGRIKICKYTYISVCII